MNLTEYQEKVLGKLIDYDGVYGSQCVDLIKNYTKEVLNFRLGTFGGSAKTGWANNSNTFGSSNWEKIENNLLDKNQVPKRGDVIFFGTGKYGHVAIVLSAKLGENRFVVLEQNVGNADGFGSDDAIKVGEYKYSNVLGWYSFKKESRYNELISDLETVLAKHRL